MGRRNAQILEQGAQGVGAHRGTTVGMHGQLPGTNALTLIGFRKQRLGQVGVFAIGDQPADNRATEDPLIPARGDSSAEKP